MSFVDPIGNLLTSIRNGARAGKPHIDVPASRITCAVADCLKKEGFLDNWRRIGEGNPQGTLRIYLKYTKNRLAVVKGIRQISKPGRRVYVSQAKIPRVLSGIGVAVLSTPQGVLTGHEARTQGTGGELICTVW